MNATTFEARTVAAYLSLNLEIHDEERGSGLLTFRLLSLTALLFWLGLAGDVIAQMWQRLGRQRADIAGRWHRLGVYWLLAGIGLRALCWGVRR